VVVSRLTVACDGYEQVFLQLLAEFRRLGATVVYANFNRVRAWSAAVRGSCMLCD
jgi:hypothetical protein